MPDQPAPRRRRWAKAALGALSLGLAWIAAANAYLVGSTRAAIVADVASAPERRCAIVLGNRVFPDGTPSLDLAERLETGAALYRAGRVKKIIVSGAMFPPVHYDEPHAMAAWLVARGIPAADVVLDVGGFRTAATMADAVKLGVREALIVTQQYHLPRAIYLARHAGIDAVGVAAPSSKEPLTARLRVGVREATARAEIIPEVALRGVRGSRRFIANPAALR
jgi:SanA protein